MNFISYIKGVKFYSGKKNTTQQVVISIGIIMLVSSQMTYAQGKFDLTAGIGYYELTHAGISWNCSKKSSLGVYAGTNFNRNATHLKEIGVSFTHIYVKPLFWKIQPGFSIKTQYWDQDDVNYYFSNVAFLFQGSLNYPVNERMCLGIEGGAVLNYILETERKQNSEAGFPTRWNGNVNFCIRYRLTKNSKS